MPYFFYITGIYLGEGRILAEISGNNPYSQHPLPNNSSCSEAELWPPAARRSENLVGTRQSRSRLDEVVPSPQRQELPGRPGAEASHACRWRRTADQSPEAPFSWRVTAPRRLGSPHRSTWAPASPAREISPHRLNRCSLSRPQWPPRPGPHGLSP